MYVCVCAVCVCVCENLLCVYVSVCVFAVCARAKVRMCGSTCVYMRSVYVVCMVRCVCGGQHVCRCIFVCVWMYVCTYGRVHYYVYNLCILVVYIVCVCVHIVGGWQDQVGGIFPGVKVGPLHACVCISVCIYVCISLCICVCTYIYMCVYVCVYVCICVCVYMCAFMCMYVCVCEYVSSILNSCACCTLSGCQVAYATASLPLTVTVKSVCEPGSDPWNALGSRLVVVYTGKTRLAKDLLHRVLRCVCL